MATPIILPAGFSVTIEQSNANPVHSVLGKSTGKSNITRMIFQFANSAPCEQWKNKDHSIAVLEKAPKWFASRYIAVDVYDYEKMKKRIVWVNKNSFAKRFCTTEEELNLLEQVLPAEARKARQLHAKATASKVKKEAIALDKAPILQRRGSLDISEKARLAEVIREPELIRVPTPQQRRIIQVGRRVLNSPAGEIEIDTLRPLGSGGSKRIYLVTQWNKPKDDSDEYVIGEIDPSTERSIVPRGNSKTLLFQREASLTKTVQGIPNVVKAPLAWESNGKFYFLMKRYTRGNLYQLLNDLRMTPNTLSQKERVALAMDICRGVMGLHKKRVIHRDLKPANILLDQEGHAHVADLGCATESTDKGEGGVLTHPGTTHYMPPEALDSEEPSPSRFSVDTFALGAIFYELLLPETPFLPWARYRARESEDVRISMLLLSQGAYSIPEGSTKQEKAISALIQSMLKADPKQRPAVEMVYNRLAEIHRQVS